MANPLLQGLQARGLFPPKELDYGYYWIGAVFGGEKGLEFAEAQLA